MVVEAWATASTCDDRKASAASRRAVGAIEAVSSVGDPTRTTTVLTRPRDRAGNSTSGPGASCGVRIPNRTSLMSSESFEHAEVIAASPVFDDRAVCDPPDVDEVPGRGLPGDG